MSRDNREQPTYHWGTTTNIAYTGTAGTLAAAIPGHIREVRVVCTTDAFVATGAAPTATTSDTPVFAGQPEYIKIQSDDKVSAIQSASGGTLYVTQCSE